MSEPVAARVKDSTAEWLEQRAEQENITVSRLAAQILDSQAGDVNSPEPDSTEAKLAQLRDKMQTRMMEIEQDIHTLSRHAEGLEKVLAENCANTKDIQVIDGELKYKPLPGNQDGNEYDTKELRTGRGPTI
jgi:predicted phage-related endonuclease